jgi:amino acid transporter/nucleotide-binding universal stress UspA family protein
MSTPTSSAGLPGGTSGNGSRTPTNASSKLLRTTQVILVGSVMLSFISFWRTAAVVLCDVASTAYYIGGIVEQAIGKCAPWFILGVMVFSYAVRSVYIESCSMFVRGGVYRVVKEAMGGFLGKLSVSALMFDYILTGPISGVSAGQYLIGLGLETAKYFRPELALDKETADSIKAYGSALIACIITLYFFRLNVFGIHESSEKAFRIMQATTIMAVIMVAWCAVTLAAQGPAPVKPGELEGPRNTVPWQPDFHKKMNYDAGEEVDPLGFVSETRLGNELRKDDTPWFGSAFPWLNLIGVAGLFIAFGHSILAMSGEETLAQVYREVESPKLPNFKKAAFVVFVYSLCLTASISFFAVLLIPETIRMENYSGNLIGGLAMNVMGPTWAKLLLNGFVVVIGSLILSGAVNTAIIGSNGVLNRVAEDGVLPEWLLKPHPKYGTSYRILWLILAMQLITIIVSKGDVIKLGEAYAFGVVWSFVFKAMSMVVLRFRDPRPREYRVPFNIPIGKGRDLPVGLILIFLILLTSAVMNILTKETATIWGLSFTSGFLCVFVVSEQVNRRKHPKEKGHHEHLEQFNVQSSETVSTDTLGLQKPYTKLVAIRSPYNLFMLEKALAETDPDTTSVVVMTAKVLPEGDATVRTDLDQYDQQLMTAVVERAEKAGKKVKPLIVPTNNPLHAILRLAMELNAQEVILGASNKYPADLQMEQISLYWLNLHQGEDAPLTVRLLSRDRDLYLDLSGGNRVPKITERQARTVDELRAAGVGVDRVLMVHDGTRAGSDLFQSVMTMLDAQVLLGIVNLPGEEASVDLLEKDTDRAATLGRDVTVHNITTEDIGLALVDLARELEYDILILPQSAEPQLNRKPAPGPTDYVLKHAHCPVFLAVPPVIPDEVAKE